MAHHHAGRHFLQIPGPTNVPDRVLRAIDNPTIDHRGPEFGRLGTRVLANLRARSSRPAGRWSIYPASGTGAWEAALINTLSPGDTRADVPHRLVRHAVEGDGGAARLEPVFIDTDWRRGADVAAIGAALRRRSRAPRSRRSASCTTRPPPAAPAASTRCARAMDAAKHPALLMVDTISSLASIDYRHDEWGVDVTVAGSQKGLMLPPGPVVQRDQRQGAGGGRDGADCRAATGTGGRCWRRTRPATSPTRPAPTCCTA